MGVCTPRISPPSLFFAVEIEKAQKKLPNSQTKQKKKRWGKNVTEKELREEEDEMQEGKKKKRGGKAEAQLSSLNLTFFLSFLLSSPKPKQPHATACSAFDLVSSL